MEPLTLYVDGFWISPYALSAFVALEEKGLPYTVKEVKLNKKEQKFKIDCSAAVEQEIFNLAAFVRPSLLSARPHSGVCFCRRIS